MIQFKPEVAQYLDELVIVLYANDYFSYLESAELFVDKLIDFINQSITTFPSQITPLKIQYLGSNYIFYKSNQRTTWYIFFEQKGNDFLITRILNNNSEEIKWL